MGQPVLEVLNLQKTFRETATVAAVRGVSIAVEPGEIVAILGPSGCGKTTTLRIIAGLEDPDQGDVLVRGRSVLGVPAHRRNIGLVFQDLALFPHKSVFENVAFGLRMRGLRGDVLHSRVCEILRLVELTPEDYGFRRPSTLSGGERQRVALARTLVTQPALVLFDEPVVSLDRRLRDHMILEIRQIQKRLGLPAIYVTHDQESASAVADRIAIMQAGRIVQEGSPLEIYRRPQSRFVADFLGDMNFLSATVVASNGRRATVEFEGQLLDVELSAAREGLTVTLALRPEDLHLSVDRTASSLCKGRLLGWYFTGGMFVYQVLIGNGTRISVRSGSEQFAQLDPGVVWLGVRRENIRVLEE